MQIFPTSPLPLISVSSSRIRIPVKLTRKEHDDLQTGSQCVIDNYYQDHTETRHSGSHWIVSFVVFLSKAVWALYICITSLSIAVHGGPLGCFIMRTGMALTGIQEGGRELAFAGLPRSSASRFFAGRALAVSRGVATAATRWRRPERWWERRLKRQRWRGRRYCGTVSDIEWFDCWNAFRFSSALCSRAMCRLTVLLRVNVRWQNGHGTLIPWWRCRMWARRFVS